MVEVRVGIIGTGVMGSDHAAILAEGVANARLVAVQRQRSAGAHRGVRD